MMQKQLMKIIIAIDSFKGCLTSVEANEAARKAVLAMAPDAEVVAIPVSDGGEGWNEAFRYAIGGEVIEVDVCDPLMRPIRSSYLQKGDLAVIEIAKASGLTLLSTAERNPLQTTSYGTGQLVAEAIRRGCKRFVIGLGGSATSDAGQGMLCALRDAFGASLPIGGLSFCIASDVTNPLYGLNGAAHVFAPQKGATPEMIEELDRRARCFAEQSKREKGFDRSQMAGAGAAGGLGYAILQYLDATCQPGIDLLLDTIGFEQLAAHADLLITGEGGADRQTLMGKLPFGIMQRAKVLNVPCVLIAGRISDREDLLSAGFVEVECINPPGLSIETAKRSDVARLNIERTVKDILRATIQVD